MNIGIVGGAGFLGTTLIELLLEKEKEIGFSQINVFDSLYFKDSSIIPLLRHPKVNIEINDVRYKDLFIKFIKQQDVLFCFQGIVGAPACSLYPLEAKEINQDSIQTIVENVNPKTKILYACTNSIFGQSDKLVEEDDPKRALSVYASTKYEGEKLVLAAGGTSLRLATLCGVSWRQRRDLLPSTFCWKSLTDGYILLYEPHFQRNYVSVKDAGRAFIHAYKNYDIFAGKPFNTGNTKLNMSKLQLAEKVKEFMTDFVIKIDEFNKDPDQRRYQISNRRLESTGFQCLYDFDTIIPETLKAYTVLLRTENYMLT